MALTDAPVGPKQPKQATDRKTATGQRLTAPSPDGPQSSEQQTTNQGQNQTFGHGQMDAAGATRRGGKQWTGQGKHEQTVGQPRFLPSSRFSFRQDQPGGGFLGTTKQTDRQD